VSTGLEGEIVASGQRQFRVTTETEDNQPVTVIDLKKGETVLLIPEKENLSPSDLMIEPVAPQANRLNFYGSPKP